MSNFLIAGGAGFIGSNLAEHLINHGHYVRVLDNFYSGKEENLEFAKGLGKNKFELIRGDIRDKAACDKACQGIDYISLQAALRSVRIFSEFFNVETVCLRYFNVFGPKQALDDEYAVVVPKFIHCILNDQAPPIFGTGKQSRDFTYISNVVSANILAATAPGIKHEVFNVANGKDNTVLDLVGTLNKIIGKSIKPKFLPVRPGDVFRTSADITRIKQKINYKPSVSFEEGLKRAVEYFRTQWPVKG